MIGPFLITLREGVEAALIVAVLVAYVVRSGRTAEKRHIWLGAGFGVLVSMAVAAGLSVFSVAFDGRAEQVFEGSLMLAAAGLLTYMILWMSRNSRDFSQHLKDRAARARTAWALFLLAFFAVLREGVETVLFLFATVSRTDAAFSMAGAAAGLAAALVLGYLIYRGGRRLPLQTFFVVTGWLLVFVAAGLVAHGIHEFQEAGFLPTFVEHVFDVNGYLDEKGTVGSLLKALFGYNGNPSLIEVVGYWAYILSVAPFMFSGFSARRGPNSPLPGPSGA